MFLPFMSKYPDIKISASNFWKNHILSRVRQNLSSYPKLRDYNFYGNENATMSGKTRINFYYTIDGYPTETPINFRSSIRDVANSDVKVSFISTFEPTSIDWNSPQMKSKIRTWENLERDSVEVTSYNYNKYASSLSSMERRKASLIYLTDARARKRNLFKYRTMMIISGYRGESFDKSVSEILNYCNTIDLQITRVEEIDEFLKAFSPFSCQLNSKVLKKVGNNTLPDEQIARFTTYSQGKIGKTGIMFGTDIHSGFAVYKQFKKSDVDAENILITAETGGGKSYFVKYLILQLISYDYFNGTINDIEGSEYLPLAGYLSKHDNVVVLNMAEGQGCYYDPFEISLTGVDNLDQDLFTFCKSFTNTIFRVLIGETLLDSNVWAQKIVNNAIALAYSSIGVVENDKSTWGNTKGYDIFYVYSKFKDLYQECVDLQRLEDVDLELYERYKLNPEYKDTLDKVVAKLSEYFEPFEHGGIRSDVFKNRVSLSDIVDAKLLINSFGMEGRSADTIDKTQMTLSQISAANISYIRSIFSKAQGKFNFKVWEEFQRWGQFPGSAITIKTAITGGRKLGDVNFILTNNVKELLDDDRFAIFDNITSFALGAIASQSTRRRLCEELSISNLLPELDKTVKSKGNTETFESDNVVQSKYDKAFLVCLDKSVSTMVKAEVPSHISRSNIFKTGVDTVKR